MKQNIVPHSVLFQGVLWWKAKGNWHNFKHIKLSHCPQALVYDKALRLCVYNIDDHREDSASSHEDEKLVKVNGVPESKKMVGHKNHSVQSKDGFSTDMGTITNLMSEDAYNVMSFFWIGHYVWAIPLKVLC